MLAWSLSNGALVAGILSTSAGGNITTDGGSAKVNIYMVRPLLLLPPSSSSFSERRDRDEKSDVTRRD